MKALNILFYDMQSYLYKDAYDCLIAMGHNVRTITYHFENRFEDSFFMNRFNQIIHDANFDLIFSINFYPLVAISAKENEIPYVSWSCDSPLAEDLEKYFDFDTNYIFLFDREEVFKYNKKGYNNVFHMPLAVNVERLSALISNVPASLKNHFASDVSFVGSLYQSTLEGLLLPLDDYCKGYIEGIINSQMQLFGADITIPMLTDEIMNKINSCYERLGGDTHINRLGMAYAIQKQITFAERVTLIDTLGGICNIKFYSTQNYDFESSVKFMGPVKYHTEMPIVFNSSKINLCPTLRSIVSGIPLRSLDICACGGALMSNYQPELAEYFVDGKDVIMYGSLEEAIDKAAYYLNNTDELHQIAINGQTIAREQFKYQDKLEQILSCIDK